MSTSEDVQYIGGYHDACRGYHEYIGGCSVHRGDTMSTSGDIQYNKSFQQKLKGFYQLAPSHASYLPDVLNMP